MNSYLSARFSSLGLSLSPTSLNLQESECSMVSSRFEQQLRRGEKMSRRDGETRSSGLDAGETRASRCGEAMEEHELVQQRRWRSSSLSVEEKKKKRRRQTRFYKTLRFKTPIAANKRSDSGTQRLAIEPYFSCLYICS
ncbi:unnamed protein product [Brassica rapa subsp. narinosa]|uniref:(rape) hypothetical protein n=1 Tax=Brassica napus TaxID=3708 RepID=A0A816WVP4_BRANA|nr:unnamed protein product [Brassica napus]